MKKQEIQFDKRFESTDATSDGTWSSEDSEDSWMNREDDDNIELQRRDSAASVRATQRFRNCMT